MLIESHEFHLPRVRRKNKQKKKEDLVRPAGMRAGRE